MKVREDGRTVNVACLVAVGVNADGHREVLGRDVCAEEDGAGWPAFLRSLSARGLSGVKLVISDTHRGLVAAVGSALPGTAWQRCRTHLRNLPTKVAKSAQPCTWGCDAYLVLDVGDRVEIVTDERFAVVVAGRLALTGLDRGCHGAMVSRLAPQTAPTR